MAFGFKSLPTRKYAYDVAALGHPDLKDSKGYRVPFGNHDLAVDQLRKAHEYHNKLIEIERKRRLDSDAIIKTVSPNLTALLKDAEDKKEALKQATDLLSQSNSQNRKRNTDKTLTALVKQRREESKTAWTLYKEAKKAAYADPDVRTHLACVESEALSAAKLARDTAIEGGLYWGTANMIPQRVSRSGKPPDFPSWTGEGTLSIQFQRKPDKSSSKVPVLKPDGTPKVGRTGKPMTRNQSAISATERTLMSPTGTLVRLERRLREDGTPTKQWWVHFRIASDEKENPIWVKLPTYYHRPLHPDGDIKWVHLVRKKTGDHYRWQVQFDLARKSWDDPDERKAKTGTVAVALGWRKVDGDIRTAVWVGDDGRQGEVRIPERRLTNWEVCDHLHSLRDTQFNADKAALLEWMAGRDLTEEWKKETLTLPTWRSPRRLTRFVRWWRYHRIAGDDEIFLRLYGGSVPNTNPKEVRTVDGIEQQKTQYTGGACQEKHLNDWEQFTRRNLKRWRRWFYRQTAIALSRRYARVVFANIDWHQLGENAPTEETDKKVSKTNRGRAAVAELKTEMVSRMRASEESAVNVTRTCHQCSELCPPPDAGRFVYCERCGGEPIDRAYNAARNLLNRAVRASEQVEAVLA